MRNCKVLRILTENFRNLRPYPIELSPHINCIFGANGNGKTNLLELVYFLSHNHSFRKNTGFPQILNIEGENAGIYISTVLLDENDEQIPLSAKIFPDSQEWWQNNQLVKKHVPLPCVFVNPFDSYLFHTSSTFRRQWLDTHLSQLDAEYKKMLGRFQKSLKMRNALLSHGESPSNKMQLGALDEGISVLSAFLSQRREQVVADLNKFITNVFRAIFDEDHELVMETKSVFRDWDASKIFEFYRSTEGKDFDARHTLKGIHRDDVLFSFDGLNSFEFCSLGQQKMSFLSLQFAFIELFRYKFSFYPIVLIDDVSGELDEKRWKNLIQYLATKPYQVLITTANENFRNELEKIPHVRRIFMEHGSSVSHGEEFPHDTTNH